MRTGMWIILTIQVNALCTFREILTYNLGLLWNCPFEKACAEGDC